MENTKLMAMKNPNTVNMTSLDTMATTLLVVKSPKAMISTIAHSIRLAPTN